MLRYAATLALAIYVCAAFPAAAQESLPNASDPKPATTTSAGQKNIAIVSLQRAKKTQRIQTPPVNSGKPIVPAPLTPPLTVKSPF